MVDVVDRIRKLIDQLSLSEIGDLIGDLAAEKDRRLHSARQELLDEMTAKAASIGLSAKQLVLGDHYIETNPSPTRKAPKPRQVSKPPVMAVVAYKGPDGATWSGKGRLPNWLKAAEEEGKSREDFKVQ